MGKAKARFHGFLLLLLLKLPRCSGEAEGGGMGSCQQPSIPQGPARSALATVPVGCE